MLQTKIEVFEIVEPGETNDAPTVTVIIPGAVSYQEAQDVVEKWLRLGAVVRKDYGAPNADGSMQLLYIPISQVQEIRVRLESVNAPGAVPA